MQKIPNLSATICQAPVGNSLKSIITGMQRDGRGAEEKETGRSEQDREDRIGVNKRVSETKKAQKGDERGEEASGRDWSSSIGGLCICLVMLED